MSTTFISAGTQMFNHGCRKLHRKRSHGRLKAYASCDDVRAWSNVPGIRQRHLYDIINEARTGYGNYIPILDLVKLLGVPTTGVVLAEALKKLNRISEILGETDMQHPSLTPSQLELENLCFDQTGRSLEGDALRNLRCLVAQLYERSKDFDQVKCERDELRSRFKDLEEDESQEVLHLKTEKNCLQERLSAMEGIECRMRIMMNKYDATLKENRQIKLENLKLLKQLMQGNDQTAICKENENLKRDKNMLTRRMHMLECNSRDMIEEITALKCSLADQEDEIYHLTNTVERITAKYDCLMEQVRYALNEFQLEITDDLRVKDNQETRTIEMEEYKEKMALLRERIRSIILELAQHGKYPDPPFDLTRAKGLEGSVKSEYYMDARLRCDYLKEALELTGKKLKHAYDVESEVDTLKEELQESLERVKSLEEEITDIESLKVDNESMKHELEDLKQDFKSLEQISEQMSGEIREKDIEIEKLEVMSREFQEQSDKFDEFIERISELEELVEKSKDAVSLQEKLEESLEKQQELEVKEKEYIEERKSLQTQVLQAVKVVGECDKLEEEVALLKLKIKDLEKELESKEKSIIEARKGTKELEREVHDLEIASVTLSDKVQRDEKEMGTMEDVMKELDECLAKRKKETEELKNKINDLNSEIDKLNREVQEKNNKLTESNNELSSLKTRLSELTDSLKECTSSKVELEGELNKAVQRTKQLESEVGKNKDALENVKRFSMEEAGKIKEQQNTIIESNDKCKDLEDSLNKALKDLDIAKRDKAEWEDQNYKLQIKIKDIISEKEMLEKKLNDVTQDNTKLGRDIDELTKRNALLEDTNKELKNNIGNIEKQLTDCSIQKSSCEKELSGCQTQIKSMQDQLSKYKLEVDQWAAKEAQWRAMPPPAQVSTPISQQPAITPVYAPVPPSTTTPSSAPSAPTAAAPSAVAPPSALSPQVPVQMAPSPQMPAPQAGPPVPAPSAQTPSKPEVPSAPAPSQHAALSLTQAPYTTTPSQPATSTGPAPAKPGVPSTPTPPQAAPPSAPTPLQAGSPYSPTPQQAAAAPYSLTPQQAAVAPYSPTPQQAAVPYATPSPPSGTPQPVSTFSPIGIDSKSPNQADFLAIKSERDSLKTELNNLKQAYEDLRKINDTCQKMLLDLKNEKESLEGTINALSQSPKQKYEPVIDNSAEIAALKKQLAASTKTVEETRRKSEILLIQVANDADACEVYKKELDNIKALLKDSERTVDDLQIKLRAGGEEQSSLGEENDQLKKVIEGNRRVEAALQEELNSCTSSKDKLQVELDEAKKTIKEKDLEIQRCNEKIKSLQEECEQIKASCQQVTNYAQNVKKKNEEIRRSQSTLQDKLKSASYDVESLKETNKTKTVQAEKLEKAVKENSVKLKESASNCDELQRRWLNVQNEKDRLAKALEDEKGKLDKSDRENMKLKDQLKECNVENNTCKNMLDMLKNDNAKLLSKVDKLNFDLRTCTKEYEKSSELNIKKDKEIENLKKKIDESMNLVKGLQTQLCQCEVEVENGKNKMSNLNGDLKTCREKIDKIMGEYDESESTNRLLNKQLEKLENHIGDLSRNNKSLEVMIQKSIAETNNYKGLLVESQNKYKVLDIEFRDKQKELKAALKTINDLNSQVSKLINEIKRLEGRIEDLEDIVSRKQHEVEGLTDLINDLNFKLEACEIAKQKIEDEMTETMSTVVKLKKDFTKCNQALKESLMQIDDLKLEKSSILLEKQGLEDRLNRYKQTMDDLEDALNKEEAKNKLLEDKISSQVKELDTLKDEYSLTMTDFTTLKSELESITNEYRAMADRLENAEKDNYNLKKDCDVLKDKVDELTNFNDSLREQKNEMLTKIGTGQQMLMECEFSIKKFEDENENLRGTLNKMTVELTLKTSSVAACQQQVEENKKTIIELNMEIASYKQAITNLNDENEELKSIIDFLKRETMRLESILFDCRKQSDDKDYHILEITRKMNDFEAAMDNYRIVLENVEEMFKRSNEERNKFKKEVDSLTLTVNGLEKIRANLEDDIINSKSKLKKLGCELEQSRADYDALMDSKLELTNELLACKATVTSQCEVIKRIKDLLNKTEKEKDLVEENLRIITDTNIKLCEQLDDLKRKLASSMENESICESKLKTEMIEHKGKKNTIQCLENEIKNTKVKLAVTEKEMIELKMERDCLQSDVMELSEIIQMLKAEAPEDTPLNAVLAKIMKCGFMACNLTELSELHECVIDATEKLVACGDGMPGPGPPAISLEPKPRAITQETKEFVLKLGPLHKQLASCQQQAKKRCCALTESVQKYQHELNALREWDYEFAKRLEKDAKQDPTLIAVQQRASQYNQSKLAHFIAAGCKKQQEAVAEINQLTKALERVETVQNSAINNKLPQQAMKIAECLKKKLEEACENEKKLYCLLQKEKQRAACFEYQLCKRLEPTQDLDEPEEQRSLKEKAVFEGENKVAKGILTASEINMPGNSNESDDIIASSSLKPSSRRICPPFPSMDNLIDKEAPPTKSKISLTDNREKTDKNRSTNDRNSYTTRGSGNITTNASGRDYQSCCSACPTDFPMECDGKKRSVSFCNKVDTKYIKPDS